MSQEGHPTGREDFEILGLTAAEERVYRELVRRRSITPRELAEELGQSTAAMRRIVGVLLNSGFATWTSGRPRRLMAAPPAAAVDVIALDIERKLQRARVAATQLATEWSSAARERTADELVEIVTSRAAMSRRFEALVTGATEEVLGFNAAPIIAQDHTNIDINADALARGVAVRSIYERSLLERPGTAEMIAELERLGEKARSVDVLPTKMVVVDRRTALLPVNLDRPEPAPSAAVVHGPLASVLTSLFEEVWRRALPIRLDAPVAEVDQQPSREELRILTLLFAGMTDDAVGRQLGLSRRTVIRRVHDLMRRYGVTTRLQLAWLAGQKGWILPRG